MSLFPAGGCKPQQAASAQEGRSTIVDSASASAPSLGPQDSEAPKPGTPPTRALHPQLKHGLRESAAFPDPVHRFSIPLKQARFDFVDLGYEKPLVEAGGNHALVFNGGYWAFAKEKRVIQGLVIVNDKQLAPKTRASGGVVAVQSGRARMTESRAYRATPGTALALQCSPRLLASGRVIDKLNTTQKAARTALCITADASVLHVYLTEPSTRITLPQFAAFLQREGCLDALNLDGGPSTAAVAKLGDEAIEVGYGVALPYGIGVTVATPKPHH